MQAEPMAERGLGWDVTMKSGLIEAALHRPGNEFRATAMQPVALRCRPTYGLTPESPKKAAQQPAFCLPAKKDWKQTALSGVSGAFHSPQPKAAL